MSPLSAANITAAKRRMLRLIERTGYTVSRIGRQPEPIDGPVDGVLDNERWQLAVLRRRLGDLTSVNEPTEFPASQILYERVSLEGQDELDQIAPEIGTPTGDIQQGIHVLRERLRVGALRLPEHFGVTGLSKFQPPDDIHAMVRADGYVGDVYYSDVVAAALMRRGSPIAAGQRVLDFGSSSGRVVRTLASVYGEAEFFACDPNGDAIGWASDNIPTATFSQSPLAPPTTFEAGSFDVAYAISIWSHYSESAAQRWFEEMHRIIAPGGHLVFTTHGAGSLLHYLDRAEMSEETSAQGLDRLLDGGYFFHDVFSAVGGDWGVPAVDWGNTYYTPAAILRMVQDDWSVSEFRSRHVEGNQDLYVLRRK